MTDIEDTQLSSMADDTISPSPRYKSEAEGENAGTPPVDDTAVLVAESDTKIQKDLLAD